MTEGGGAFERISPEDSTPAWVILSVYRVLYGQSSVAPGRTKVGPTKVAKGAFLSWSPCVRWPDQVQMAHAKSKCQFVKSDNCWVTPALLKATDVLLAEARDLSKLLLRQAFSLSYPPNVPSDQSAHVHAQKSADYIL
jgi:hypothetical protein